MEAEALSIGSTFHTQDNEKYDGDLELFPQLSPQIEDVTADLDNGYDGDCETEQLPDEIEEPVSDTEPTSNPSDGETRNLSSHEASLVKGLRKLTCDPKLKDHVHLTKPQTLKRTRSQMLSESGGSSNDDIYVIPSRAVTPGTPSKRREIRRLRTVPLSKVVMGGEAEEDEDIMDLDILSSPMPPSETGYEGS